MPLPRLLLDEEKRRSALQALCVLIGLALLEIFSMHAICWWGEPWYLPRPFLGDAIFDYDEMWHLASGRVIVEQGSVPLRDPFTYTAGETPWVNTNWLAQVVLYGLYRTGGLALDWVFGRAIFMGAVLLAFIRARKRVASAWASVPAGFFVLCALRTASTIRPQGWTFLLLALSLLLVDRLREKATPARAAALFLVVALSGQLHGGFVFLYIALAVAAVSEVWDLARGEKGASRDLAIALGTVLALSALSFVFHPHGFRALLHPLAYVRDPRVREIFVVNELAPTDASTEVGFLVELGVLSVLGLACVARRPWSTSELASVLVFGHLAFQSLRGLHYFAVVLAAPLAFMTEGALEALRERGPWFAKEGVLFLDRLEPAARIFGRWLPVALLLALATALSLSVGELRPGVNGDLSAHYLRLQSDTADMASYVRTKAPPGNLYNVPETGGVLAWTLYPDRRIFIDGRGDLHALALDHQGPLPEDRDERNKIPSTWRDSRMILDTHEGWIQALDRRACDLALVPRETHLERALRQQGWKAVRENKTQALFVRPGSAAEASLREK